MNSAMPQIVAPGCRYSALLAAAVLGGCLQTAPVVVTPQDQAARLFYNCPNGRTLDVTRVRGNTSVLVVVDGKTLQLPRDAAMTSAERYSNRVQTLTLFGNSATFESFGQPRHSPCTAAGVPDSTDEPQQRPRRSDGS